MSCRSLRFRDLENQLAAAEPRLQVPREPEEATVAYLARLLNAVDRLRAERDDLRRNMSFLEIEAKFTAEALEAHRHNATPTSHTGRDQLGRLNRTVTVLAIVISHLQLPVHATTLQDSEKALSLQEQLKQATYLCSQKDGIIEQNNQKLSDLEIRLNVQTLDLAAAESQRNSLFAQVKTLEETDIGRTEVVEREGQAVLQQVEAQLASVTKVLEETESQRDSLNLQLTNLQSDLTAAQRDLTDAQTRYSTLQSRQLATMSSNEATKALRSQIEELEMRVLRRTEQIGIHQHDIKRLETNLRLSEERVGELMAEVEVLGAEKAAMVEDCADAREARDEALEKVERLDTEIEALRRSVEQLETTREGEAITLVEIITKAMGKMRVAMSVAERNSREASRAVESHERAVHDLKRLADEYQRVVEELGEKKQEVTRAEEDARQAVLAVKASKDTIADLKGRHSDINTENDKRAAELEIKLQELQRVNETMQTDHDQAIAVLVRSREELEEQLAESNRLHSNDLDNELELLRSQQVAKIGGLQRQLDEASSELETVRRLHAEAESDRMEANMAREELARTNQDLETRAEEATERSIAAHQMLTEAVSKHESEFGNLQRQLDESVQQVQHLQERFREADNARSQEAERSQCAESKVAQLQQQVAESQKHLDNLKAEKASNEMMATSLQAETQRLLSLERYLRNQVQDG
jgi:chromosome segregation ATPase